MEIMVMMLAVEEAQKAKEASTRLVVWREDFRDGIVNSLFLVQLLKSRKWDIKETHLVIEGVSEEEAWAVYDRGDSSAQYWGLLRGRSQLVGKEQALQELEQLVQLVRRYQSWQK